MKPRSVIMALVFLGATGLVAARTMHSMNVPGEPNLPRYGLEDFRDAGYYPVVALLEGRNPYDVPAYLARYPVGHKFPLYSPITLLVHLPYGLLSPAHAQYVHFCVDVLLTLVVAAVTLWGAGIAVTPTAAFGLGTAVVVSHPGNMSLYLGQSTLYVVLGVYLALLTARSRPWLAGAGLALACLKPTFGLPVAALMLIRGDARAVTIGAALAVAAGGSVAAFLAYAAGGVEPFARSLIANYASWDVSPFINFNVTVHRIDAFALFDRMLGKSLSGAAAMLVAAAMIALGGLAARRVARAEGDGARPLSSGIIAVTTLVCAYHQAYDALLLTLPAVSLAIDQWAHSGLALAQRTRVVSLGLMAVPALNYLATYAVLERLGIEGGWRLLITSLNACALLTLFVLLVSAALGPGTAGSDPRLAARSAL